MDPTMVRLMGCDINDLLFMKLSELISKQSSQCNRFANRKRQKRVDHHAVFLDAIPDAPKPVYNER